MAAADERPVEIDKRDIPLSGGRTLRVTEFGNGSIRLAVRTVRRYVVTSLEQIDDGGRTEALSRPGGLRTPTGTGSATTGTGRRPPGPRWCSGLHRAPWARSSSVSRMWKSVQRAARATVQLVVAAALAFGAYIFITVLLIAAVATLAVVGCRDAARDGAADPPDRRGQAAPGGRVDGPGDPRGVPADRPGTLRERLRTAVRDPGTLHRPALDGRLLRLRLPSSCLALPLWPVGLVVDGVWCGLLRREAVVLPLISRLADLDAAWSTALLKPSPEGACSPSGSRS